MYHPIDSRYLYSAAKLSIAFEDEYGKFHSASGTGFVFGIGEGKKISVLISNRHVLDAGFSDLRKRQWALKGIIFSGYGNSKEYFEIDVNDWELVFTSNGEEDIAALVLKKCSFLKGEERFSGVVNFDLDILADHQFHDLLNVGDFVVLPGYPEFHDKNTNRPILRSGIIASDPLHDYAGPGMAVGLRTLAYEAFSTAGTSGGPVFALGVGFLLEGDISGGSYRPPRIIGINAGHISMGNSGSHSGISYLYKSTVIIELLGKVLQA